MNKQERAERRATAETIIVFYYASVFAKGKARENPNVPRIHSKKLKELAPAERKHFLRAADLVKQLEADPREFIISQFHAFAEYSASINRFMLPMPHQLHTLAAMVRYQRYKGQQELREARKAPKVETTVKASFFREERRLNGLSRMNRCMPEDVLADKPEEFTKEFLKHKGVWTAVKDVWYDRAAS